MKIKAISFLITAITALIIGGCGGGGGGGGGSTSTVVTGVASKGPITGATVVVYAITAGAKGAELGRFTPTLADGNYSVNIGTYTGPVLVESTGGTYTDEATGLTLRPVGVLRAFADNASGATSVAVTPLTEMAAVNIGTAGITPAIIKANNAAIAATFGVSDIIGVLPVNAAAAPGTATTAQIDYGLALATFAKYMQTKSLTLGQAITALGAATPAAQTLADLAVARSAFISSVQNLTGVTGNTTATAITLKLSTKGTLAVANSIGGVQLTLNLPAGVDIVNTAGVADPTKVVVSGVAVVTPAELLAGVSNVVGANYVTGTPNTIKVIVTKQQIGFGTGEFVTLTLRKTNGSIVTPAHFVVTGFKAVNGVVDINGNLGDALTGVDQFFTATFQ